MTHRRDIEGLRALAVVAVLLFHFEVPGAGGGFVGVDVFFVISGFLITSLLVTEREREGTVALGAFYARRIRRLLPISATVLAATSLVSLAWLEPTRLADLATDVRGAALFAANFVFADRGADYLTSDLAPSPLQHYWSLGVEEQFYVVWPVLLSVVCIGALRPRARITAVLVAVSGASLAASVMLTPDSASWSYYGPHTRAWELAAGALLAVGARRLTRSVSPGFAAGAAWVGIGLIVASVTTFGSVTDFPGIVALVPVAGAVLVLAGGAAPEGPSRLLSWRPLQYLGSRSYSLYLWHWPALVLAQSRAGRDLTVPEKLLVACVVVVLSETGFRLIEQPARRSSTLAVRTRLTAAVGAALVAAGLASSVVVARHDPDLDTGVTAQVPVVSPSTTQAPVLTTTTAPGPIDTSADPAPTAVADALRVKVLPDNLRPGLRRALYDTPVTYGDSCHRFESRTPKYGCVYGDPASPFTIALWGDSHAAQWFTPLSQIASDRGWRLLSVTQGSCGYLDVVSYNAAKRTVQRNCAAWRDAVRALMRAEGVDVVFVGQFNGMREASSRKRIGPARWRELLPGLVTSLRAERIEPVVLADTPNPPDVVPECLARNRRQILSCTTKAADGWSERIDAVQTEIAAEMNVGLVEPARWLCHEGRCPAVVGDILVYRDDNHVSDTAMIWLRPLIEAAIAPYLESVRLRG